MVVVRSDSTRAVPDRADGDHARMKIRGAGGQEGGLEELEKVEVPEVICAKLCFEAVFGLAFGGGHDAVRESYSYGFIG